MVSLTLIVILAMDSDEKRRFEEFSASPTLGKHQLAHCFGLFVWTKREGKRQSTRSIGRFGRVEILEYGMAEQVSEKTLKTVER